MDMSTSLLDSIPLLRRERDSQSSSYEIYNSKYIVNTLAFNDGQGCFNQGVYDGWIVNTDKKIAVKKIFIKRDRQKYIQREISILKIIKHPNIIEYIDCLRDQNYIYLITGYINGNGFDDIDKPVKESTTKAIIYQIFRALVYLHANHITHRDLKPENILIDFSAFNKNVGETRFNIVKIIDFGLSSQTSSLHETQCGTPLYMAPEMVFDKPYDEKADIYSVAIIMYELLFGHNPVTMQIKTGKYQKGLSGLAKMLRNNFTIPESFGLSDNCIDFLKNIIDVDATKRYNYEQIMKHPWFSNIDSISNKYLDDIIVNNQKQIQIEQKKDDLPFEFSSEFDDVFKTAFQTMTPDKEVEEQPGIDCPINSPLHNCINNYKPSRAITIPCLPVKQDDLNSLIKEDYSGGSSGSPSPRLPNRGPVPFRRDSGIKDIVWDGIRVSWDMMSSSLSLRNLKTI